MNLPNLSLYIVSKLQSGMRTITFIRTLNLLAPGILQHRVEYISKFESDLVLLARGSVECDYFG